MEKMEQDTIEKMFNRKLNSKKLSKLTTLEFLRKEIDIVKGMSRGIEYYNHIIDNVTINNNAQNSFILWLFDKTEIIDLNRKTIFVQGTNAYPDIDVDFPTFFRKNLIEYIKGKYGEQHVCQVCTFSRLQGRAALREVMRASQGVPQEVMNEISKKLPQEAEIADKMQEEKEVSIIRWTLKNEPEKIADYCKLEDGKLVGEFAAYFQDAIELEGTLKSYGKHASALIISDKVISSCCPMLIDKESGDLIMGVDFESGEKMGFVKMDLLGLRTLDVLMTIKEIIRTGKVNKIVKVKNEEEFD